MTYKEPPSFLSKGTFYWDNLGFFYSDSPPINLLSKEALASEDPWIVLAATLEFAKKGEHSALKVSGFGCMRQHDP